jgi:hypothetical protein
MTDNLRIRIPRVDYCMIDECTRYTEGSGLLCRDCKLEFLKIALDAWMGKKVTTTTLPRKSKLIHSTPLSSFLSR